MIFKHINFIKICYVKVCMMSKMKTYNITFEQMRDNIRQILHHDFPNSFPYGYRGASVTELAHKIFYNKGMNAYTQLDCVSI